MKPYQRILAFSLVLLLGATVYGLIRTSEPPKVPASVGKGKQPVSPQVPLVDLTPLKTAQELAQQVATQEESDLANEALKKADYEVDLAYEAALRDAREHPPALSAAAKEAKDRLQKAQKLIADDDTRIAALNEAIAKTKDSDKKENLQEQLDVIQADRDLASDEADEAQEDFRREGGDLADLIQEAKKQHEELQHTKAGVPVISGQAPQQFGLIHLYQEWSKLHTIQLALWRAKQDAENTAATLSQKHNVLEATLESEKEKSPELVHHVAKKKSAGASDAPP